MNTNTQTAAPVFVWDNDYKNHEQMRPYMEDFVRLHAELDRGDGIAYNASFKGKIPGLAESPNEDTGIYLLQTLRVLDEEKAREDAFLASGGYRLSERTPGPNERGTLVRRGWYVGGSGWGEQHHVKVQIDESRGYPCVQFKAPRQRNWRTFWDGPASYLFKPEGK